MLIYLLFTHLHQPYKGYSRDFASEITHILQS